MGGLLLRLFGALIVGALTSPAYAQWHQARSNHFIIYSEQRPEQIRNFAERLERVDQAARHVLRLPDPPLTDSGKLTIYVLPNTEAVGKLAGSRSVYGFYVARTAGSVAFVPATAGGGSRRQINAEDVFFHEYAHHLQLQTSHAALPQWVTEGFAEFFSTAEVRPDGSVALGKPPLHRGKGLFEFDHLNIADMLGGTYRLLTVDEVESIYGRGWLLTHYLTFDPTRKGQLVRYIDSIQEGVSALDSAKAAFGDLGQLSKDLDRYMRSRRLNYLLVDGKTLSPGPVAIRPLTVAEAAVMPVRLRSERGVDTKSAPGVAAQARRAAAPYPFDPFAQTALAEAEFDARNYEAAEGAADRAVATDPNSLRALIYKARSLMERAKKNQAAADWNGIRNIIARANRLDNEAAEPLLLFYESYRYAGERPTDNAIEGLLYAAVLVPQDTKLKLTAVEQLLMDKRLAEAGRLFAPLAFSPHARGKWRESNAKVMAAIAAGDAAAAAAALKEVASENEDD